MPPLDDNDLELTSSDSSETLDAATNTASTETAQVADAESSSAESDASQPEDMLSIVRDVVDKREQPEAETASSAEGEDDGQAAAETDPKTEQDNEEYSDVPFNKHPRFQQLLRQAKTYKEDATRYQNVQSFLDTNGLNAQEAADGLIILAMMKTDPVQAWKHLKPAVEQLLQRTGEILPQDLQQRVDAGDLSRDAAFEISTAPAQVESSRVRQSFEAQQRERTQQQERGSALYQAAASWEQDRHVKDPNFANKVVALQKELAWLHTQEGKPNTPDGVRDQLNRAYRSVNEQVSRSNLRPGAAPRAIRPVTGGQVTGNTRAEPQTMLEVVRAARAGAA